MDRRGFLRASLSAAAVSSAAFPGMTAFGQEGKSRVVVVRNMALAEEPGESVVRRIFSEMVHEGVRAFVGGEVTREEAWRRFLKPEDIVGVKLNAIAAGVVPHPDIVDAIAAGAVMCGIPRNHVIVFDKEDRDLEKGGYTINKGGSDVQCYGTIGPPGSGNPGYEERQTFRGDTAYKLSRIVSRQCTALVNVPVLKDHCWAGLTCALKNHFGSIDNPNAFHKVNHCTPAIVDVGRDANIRTKQRLIICDAKAIQYEGGPSFKPQYLQPYYAILVGTDPVAVDTVAMQLIDMCRVKRGLVRLLQRNPEPIHIAEAAKQGMGTNDLSRIELVVKELGPKGK